MVLYCIEKWHGNVKKLISMENIRTNCVNPETVDCCIVASETISVPWWQYSLFRNQTIEFIAAPKWHWRQTANDLQWISHFVYCYWTGRENKLSEFNEESGKNVAQSNIFQMFTGTGSAHKHRLVMLPRWHYGKFLMA